MKKDMIFAPAMLLVGILLGLLKVTGLTAHIAISVVGILVLGAYTAATKKEWEIPALEVAMRIFYGIALITGVVVMKATGVVAVAIVHKVCAALFVVLLVVLFVLKMRAKKA